ncbi:MULTISPECIES: glutamate racemase [Rodentibacter]|uniref:glutamate racemase n=1 Tax=Rodentibacter TaxID=1960084 RepID=UPI001CFD0D79|nr:glutamate racemase [Rodentibacter sp. JRC1]GJI55483.1 glutamate racemase [Rodentibacter sp. JRC1]
MNKPSILFFDSGVGGFSIYQEVRALFPDHHYLYCCDNEGFPYSEKSEQIIIERTLKICRHIHTKYPLDLIVIACNTASTVVLPTLRQYFSIPIVGTVPAIKPAAEISQTKHIGLLATKGTVKRGYIDKLIQQFAYDCNVERLGSTLLAEMAEKKLYGYPVNITELANELAPWQSMSDLDTLILGCTHFPLIRKEIQQCLPQVKFFMQPGRAIAQRIKHLLARQVFAHKQNICNTLFCTQPLINGEYFQQRLPNWGFETFRVLNIR